MKTSIFLLWAAAALCVPRSAAAQEAVTYDYVVQRGDTCVRIAIRELGSRAAYKLLHKHNPWLGEKLPHRLKPGTVLKLPVVAGQPKAVLTEKQGNVRVRKPAVPQWQSAQRGMDLFRAWRVNSRAKSSAEVTFLDESSLQMREHTLVIIYGPTAKRARRLLATAELERGSLRTRLADLAGQRASLVVQTPSSQAELGSGSAVVSADELGMSRIANHRGSRARVRGRRAGGRRGKPVLVEKGYGTKVEKGRDPDPPRPLLPPPTWLPASSVGLAWSNEGGTLHGRWAPAAGAASYRVELARDQTMRELIVQARVDHKVNQFEAHRLPPGEYYVRLATLDQDGLEGAPGPIRKMSVVRIEILPPGEPATSSEERAEAPSFPEEPLDTHTPVSAPVVIAGTRVRAPEQLSCTAGGQSELRLLHPGDHELRCVDSAGKELKPLAIRVVELKARVAASAETVGPLPRGQSTPFALALDRGETVGGKFAIRAPEGIEIESQKQSNGLLRLTLTPGRRAPQTAELELIAAGDPGGPALAKVAIEIEPVVVQAPPPPRLDLQVGLFGGFSVVDDDYQLGNGSSAGYVVDHAGLGGLRLAYSPWGRLGFEVEGTGSRPGFREQGMEATPGTSTVLGFRGHGMFQVVHAGPWRVFALAGGGGQRLLSTTAGAATETDLALHWGLGLLWRIAPRLDLRGDARHLIAPGGQDRFDHLLEVHLGVALWYATGGM